MLHRHRDLMIVLAITALVWVATALLGSFAGPGRAATMVEAAAIPGPLPASAPRADRLARQIVRERLIHQAATRSYRKRLRAQTFTPSITSAATIAHLVYGVPVNGLRRLALCESRDDIYARNPTGLGPRQYPANATGWTQILYRPDGKGWSTWHRTPYRNLSPYDVYANALAAGYLWRTGGGDFDIWADVCANAGNAG